MFIRSKRPAHRLLDVLLVAELALDTDALALEPLDILPFGMYDESIVLKLLLKSEIQFRAHTFMIK
jgi:hypothetical protein